MSSLRSFLLRAALLSGLSCSGAQTPSDAPPTAPVMPAAAAPETPSTLVVRLVRAHEPGHDPLPYTAPACVTFRAECLVGDGSEHSHPQPLRARGTAVCEPLRASDSVWTRIESGATAEFAWPCRGASQIWATAHIGNQGCVAARDRLVVPQWINHRFVAEVTLDCSTPEGFDR